MTSITIYGLASGKNILLPPIKEEEWDLTLLVYLRKLNIPLASSCNGQGQCKKCVVNTDQLSCQIKLKELRRENPTIFTYTVKISYF